MRSKISPVMIASPERRVPSDRIDAHPLGDRLQRVRFLVVDESRPTTAACRGRAARTARPVASSLRRRKRMSKAALCATSTVSSQKVAEAGSTRSIVGWSSSMERLDAGDPARLRRHGAPRVDELLEHLVLQQAAVDDPDGADGNDLVALGRLQPGGLGVEHRVAQARQRPVVLLRRLARLMEQVEIVELGPAFAGRAARSTASLRVWSPGSRCGSTRDAKACGSGTRSPRCAARRSASTSAGTLRRPAPSDPSATPSWSRCRAARRSRSRRDARAGPPPRARNGPRGCRTPRAAGWRGRRSPA